MIHANRMLLKIWPHLTFGWPFVNISLTMHPTRSKLYIFVILITSRVIWYTWKVIWSILKIWPVRDPYWEGAKSSKILSNYFLTCNDFKTINNSFSSKWHLSTVKEYIVNIWVCKCLKINAWFLTFSFFYASFTPANLIYGGELCNLCTLLTTLKYINRVYQKEVNSLKNESDLKIMKYLVKILS